MQNLIRNKKYKNTYHILHLGYDDVKIYNANEAYIDEDYLANLAEKIFDQGEYQVRLPYLYWEPDTRVKEETFLQKMEDADHHIDPFRMMTVSSASGLSKPKEDPSQTKVLPQSNIFVNFYDDSHLQIYYLNVFLNSIFNSSARVNSI